MIRDTLTKKIEKSQARLKQEPRNYIGASIIGSPCLRQIWYEFKGIEAEEVPTKTIRTWAIGKNLEGLILDWLEEAGLKIVRLYWDLKSEKEPSFQGHVDALWEKNKKEWQGIIEIKTAKNASFNIFAKKGVKEWNPQYYAQIQSYMGMSKIHSAYILVLNKDNSAISDELVTFDESFYRQLEDKALALANAVSEPLRVNNSPLFYLCKMCKFKKVCHR